MGRRVIYLARHGETDWNAQGRWQGQTDVPLNANGYAQARAIGDALVGRGVAAVMSSDLTRAYETARVVAGRLCVPVGYVDPAFRERAFGPFEGRTRDECARLYPEAWRAWHEQDVVPAGAEPRAVVAARMQAGLRRAAGWADAASARAGGASEGPILVVTHGAALRAVIGHATGAPPPPIANGAIWRVQCEDGAVVAARPIEPA